MGFNITAMSNIILVYPSYTPGIPLFYPRYTYLPYIPKVSLIYPKYVPSIPPVNSQHTTVYNRLLHTNIGTFLTIYHIVLFRKLSCSVLRRRYFLHVCYHLHATSSYRNYYAPPSRPKGPRRCPDRGNAGGSLVFLSLLWLLYTLGLNT